MRMRSRQNLEVLDDKSMRPLCKRIRDKRPVAARGVRFIAEKAHDFAPVHDAEHVVECIAGHYESLAEDLCEPAPISARFDVVAQRLGIAQSSFVDVVDPR